MSMCAARSAPGECLFADVDVLDAPRLLDLLVDASSAVRSLHDVFPCHAPDVAVAQAAEHSEYRRALEHVVSAGDGGICKPDELVIGEVAPVGRQCGYGVEEVIKVGVQQLVHIGLLEQHPERGDLGGRRVLVQRLAGTAVAHILLKIFAEALAHVHVEHPDGALSDAGYNELSIMENTTNVNLLISVI